MICYYYPPMNTGGVERSVNFARYLPESGWSPIVLTTNLYGSSDGANGERIIRANEVRSVYQGLATGARRLLRGNGRTDAQLHLPPSNGMLKRITPEWIDRWLMIPDGHIKWCVFAFWPALGLIRRGEADLIYTTSPPASSHLLGLVLKKLTKKPWVMDLRDPWTFEALSPHLHSECLRLSLERRLERLCLANADAVVTNTPQSAAAYAQLYPEAADKIITVTNGFDPEEIEKARRSLNQPGPWKPIRDGVFVITHAGTFSRFETSDPTPYPLLEALKRLLDDGTISPDNCRIVFAGPAYPRTKLRIRELGLHELVDLPGMVSHDDALRLMLRSDLLLVYDGNTAGSSAYTHGKIYEYLACGKPILGLLPDGASRTLMKETGCALLAPPDDPEEIRRVLRQAIRGDNTPGPQAAVDLRRYDRRNLAKSLAGLMDKHTGR